jgi:hypothetical protein
MICHMARPPVVKSFLIADTVIQDRMSGKWSIIGVFDRIMTGAFPVFHPLALYHKLGDTEGRYKIKVELRDANDRQVALIEGNEIDVKAPIQTVELGLRMPPIPLERAGKYQFQLHVNSDFIASAPLEVLQVAMPPPPPQPPTP